MDNICNICVETFNKKTRAKITCQYCNFDSCMECCKTYILNENIPKCMNNECNKEWTRQFLSKNFTKTFINNEYKKHREEVLYNHERSLLPATQPIVEREIRREHLSSEIIKYKNELYILKAKIMNLENERFRLNGVDNSTNILIERSAFVRACPDEECRGFLSTQWKCGICQKWTCPNCHIIKGHQRICEHTCNPDDVATAELLARDTKPCPKCGTGIFKISGCDQMWCTQCHTAFSWRTGNIENNIHNPHYYEWLRRTNNGHVPRNPLDNPCGERRINNYTYDNMCSSILRKIRKLNTINDATLISNLKELNTNLQVICRNIMHLRYHIIPKYQFNPIINNQRLRIRFMRNQITEDKFKILVQQSDKKHQKLREISNLLQLLHDTTSDIILRFSEEISSPDWTYNLDTINEIDPIVNYANECFVDIGKTYDSKVITFNKFIESNIA